MTDIQSILATIKERAEKATEGPWELGDENNRHAEVALGNSDTYASLCREARYSMDMMMSREEMLANAAFIASARTDVPRLVEAVERMADALDALGSFSVAKTALSDVARILKGEK